MKKITILFLIFSSVAAYSQTIAVGAFHSLSVCTDSSVEAWGYNVYGQAGDGTIDTTGCECKMIPVNVSGLTGVVAVAGGFGFSLALKSDGTVWAWGNNGGGQLGIGSIDVIGCKCRTTPVQVSGLTDVIAISSGGGYHSLALKSNGTVWAWGNNGYGQLGDSTTASTSSPVQVKGLSGIVSILAGFNSSFALKSDGTVWSWGENNYGILGDGSLIDHHVPAQVSVLTNVISIREGRALKSDSTVWAWGNNFYGQMGDGTVGSSVSIPQQVPGLTGVVAIEEGLANFAFKVDGTIWSWGYNMHGELGDSTNVERHTPVLASLLTNMISIKSGAYYTIALRKDGTVLAWGQNNWGQLGNGTFDSLGCACLITPTPVTGLCKTATVIEEHSSNSDGFIVFPNPMRYSSNFQITTQLKNAELIIYDMFGKEMMRKRFSGNEMKIERGDLNSGVYFVQVRDEKRQWMQKIIVE